MPPLSPSSACTRSWTGWNHASPCRIAAITLRCDSIAPLDTPVVPPVYCRNATSSWASGTGRYVRRAPSASASAKRTAPGSSNGGTIFFTRRTAKSTMRPRTGPSSSPIDASTTVRTGVCAITCCSVAAKFSRMTIASAPESSSW